MPFKSKAQMRWMFAHDPAMAARWAKHTPKGKKLPERVRRKKRRPVANMHRLNGVLFGDQIEERLHRVRLAAELQGALDRLLAGYADDLEEVKRAISCTVRAWWRVRKQRNEAECTVVPIAGDKELA